MENVYFGDYASFDNWGLVLEEFDIPPAEAKTTFIDIPGGDGTIDLTEAFGEVKYKDRELSFRFVCKDKANFENLKRTISNAINGKRMRIRFSKDPGYYWVGRVAIDAYETSYSLGRITINAMVEPYKYHGEAVTAQIAAPGSGTITNSGAKAVIPTVVAAAPCTVTVNGVSKAIPAGTSKYVDLSLNAGSNSVSVSEVGSLIQLPYVAEYVNGNPYQLRETDSSGINSWLTVSFDQDGRVYGENAFDRSMYVDLVDMSGLPGGSYSISFANSEQDDRVWFNVEYDSQTGRKTASGSNLAVSVVDGGRLIVKLGIQQYLGEPTEFDVTPSITNSSLKVSFTYTERDL